MPLHRRSGPVPAPSLAFMLLCGLFVTLLIAGGASRADVGGQIVVQAVAWSVLLAAILFAPRVPLRRMGTAGLFFALAGMLVFIQLIPLPPSLWKALPGRMMLVGADSGDVWRPISMVPGATLNALSSLVVPGVVLLLATMVRPDERSHMLPLLLGLVGAAALIGLLQFSGAGFSNPFVNDTPGQVSGLFANRNHFALFLAMGCLIAPAWATRVTLVSWRLPVASGFILLFALTILATGSRAGLMVGAVAIIIALLFSWPALRKLTRKGPRWLLPSLVTGAVLILIFFVGLFIFTDRAVSINRAVSIDGNEDMRLRALPTVMHMAYEYFPIGSGFGGFDPVFRIHEPFELLKLTYFNHAHNDYIEIILDGGLLGLIVLLLATVWWAIRTALVWQNKGNDALPRLGSSIIFLIMIASFFDYPARTPLIMAVIALSGLWLGEQHREEGAALPRRGHEL
ncbi:O-antigen ligase family protein [Sphingomonas pseudosanguinis]|uniref:O-antigen ligase n=1 Tax=Sphingomonas pseudosanguinis TaxID=413712 RepID=A0A7W6AAC1_9SPHN|nr:O-antigen ligase family protein [Sphingomonas pseudosanguinis]MBB3880142.1 O-antigen ligase [Sphingomonas pseudosanguinis]MBN3538573.1 O-antigen ligase family protein [Sphingomonas pseudosanguinis]